MKKIMLYGDSIAAGLFNGQVSNMFDKFILDELSDKNMKDFVVDNQGIPGASTTSALDNIVKVNTEKFDYAIFNIGVNDAINNRQNIQEYENNLKEIISKTIAKNIIILGPSFVDKTKKPQVDYPILESYNSAAQKVAKSKNIYYLNVYKEMLNYPEMNDLLQEDGLHPSRFGYHYLAKKIVDLIIE